MADTNSQESYIVAEGKKRGATRDVRPEAAHDKFYTVLRVHPGDFRQSWKVVFHPRDVKIHPRRVIFNPRDVKIHPRAVRRYPRAVTD